MRVTPGTNLVGFVIVLAISAVSVEACQSSNAPVIRDDVADLGEEQDTGNPEVTGGDHEDSPTPEIWQPTPGTTWQWQLIETVDTSLDVVMYDIDLFDTPQQVIDDLHGDGRVVICYFSAGSWELWRDDADEFPEAVLGNILVDWENERWLDVRSDAIRPIMERRLDLAVEKGCDGVEPDNVDGYDNDSGFPLSADDQLDYNRFLARAAHARGLSVGLKNALDLVDELQGEFDWALNEECVSYDECEALMPFIDADKALFHVEYVERTAQGPAVRDRVCADRPSRFSTLIKLWDLDAWRLVCGV